MSGVEHRPGAAPTLGSEHVGRIADLIDGILRRFHHSVVELAGVAYLAVGNATVTRESDSRGRTYSVTVDGRQALHATVLRDGRTHLDRGSFGEWTLDVALGTLLLVDREALDRDEESARRAAVFRYRADRRLSGPDLGRRLLAMTVACGWLAAGARHTLTLAVAEWGVTVTRDEVRRRLAITVTEGPRRLFRCTATPGRRWDVVVEYRAKGDWAPALLAACPRQVSPPIPDPSFGWWPRRPGRRSAD